MGDIFDLLMALAQNNVPVPPAAIIEASNLPLSEKKKLQQMISTPDPMQQQAKTLALQGEQAKVGKTQADIENVHSKTMLNIAKARSEGIPDAPAPPKSPLDIAQQLADINETNATAMHKRASATGIYHKALISPLQLLADHAQRNADRFTSNVHQNADRLVDHFHRNADRQASQRMPE